MTETTSDRDVLIDRMIAGIDLRLRDQLAPIMERVHALERPWRSLFKLVSETNFRENVQLEFVSCSRQELDENIADNPIEQTFLHALLLTELYERPDTTPYAAVIGDYQFDRSRRDCAALRSIGYCAAAAHAPFIAAAHASIIDPEARSFTDIAAERLGATLQQLAAERAQRAADDDDEDPFEELRDSDVARFIVLTLPRTILREADPLECAPLYGLACWPVAGRMAASFARYRWCPNIVGEDPESGGRVHDLRAELDLTERQEFHLGERGLVSLVNREPPSPSIFLSMLSLARPKFFGTSEEDRSAELNHRLGCELPYVLITCRITHYLFAIHRDTMAISRDRLEVERSLNLWANDYVADRDVVSSAIRSRRMLRKVKITVENMEDEEAWHALTLKLRPHFKYMGAFFTLSAVSRIPKPAAESDGDE